MTAGRCKLKVLGLDLLERSPSVIIRAEDGNELLAHPAVVLTMPLAAREIYAAGHLHGYSDCVNGVKQAGLLSRVDEILATKDCGS